MKRSCQQIHSGMAVEGLYAVHIFYICDIPTWLVRQLMCVVQRGGSQAACDLVTWSGDSESLCNLCILYTAWFQRSS